MGIQENMRVFDDVTVRQHANNYHKVIISVPKQGTVEGVLTNEFQLDMAAQWDTLMNFNGSFKIVETALIAANNPAFASGAFTRKFYKGGSYINFNVEFRVVDYDGKGIVVPQAKTLMRATLPNPVNVDTVVDSLKNTATAVGNFAAESAEAVVDNGIGAGVDVIGNKFVNALNEVGSKGVQPAYVTIGSFFSGHLIIENVSIKYSKELVNIDGGKVAPLYADFTVKLSTQEVPDNHLRANNKSLNFKNGVKRVRPEG